LQADYSASHIELGPCVSRRPVTFAETGLDDTVPTISVHIVNRIVQIRGKLLGGK
jgi:hypothetical protein